MFGMAVWDSHEQTLFIARDRAGKKPVYFYRGQNSFLFASEIKSLLSHPETPRDMDEALIPEWVTFRFLPGKETLFKDIHPLPMGTWISIDSKYRMSEPKPFWSHPPPCEKSARSDDELLSTFEQELTKSVATRMVADVPVGAFLSGGLDSSMICALIRKTHSGRLKTFSVGFDTGFSEASIARTVSQHLDTDHHEFIAGSADMLSVVSKVLWSRETPISEPSDLAIYKLSEMARREVTVVLSGEGSDEILGGYPKYQAEQKLDRVPFSNAVLAAAARFAPERK